MFAARKTLLGVALSIIPTLVQADPILVAEFDFDDEFGQADAQGWRPLHREQNEESHFHVEDFSGQGAQISALAGTKSMWCGLPTEDPRTCHWDVPPGFGSNWAENLVSIPFAVQGDVTLSFLSAISVESTIDYIFVQYLGASGDWELLEMLTYTWGTPNGIAPSSYVIPAAEHDGTLQFRFFFDSDFYGDAEQQLPWNIINYGFVVDDLMVSDDTGVVNFQDFELESIGAQATSDGSWYAEPNTDLYHGGALVSGTGVLQESAETNDTHFWAFFDESTRDYGCVGHPEQLVVDETNARILSPRIDLTRDVDGSEITGDPTSITVEFDVYRDIADSEQKYYRWIIETFSATCKIDPSAANDVAKGDQKDWFTHQVTFVPDQQTRQIEVNLGVANVNFNPEHCRSHSPLIDNVRVYRTGGVVVAVDDASTPARSYLLQNVPNPFNPTTSIAFEVPPGADRVTLVIYDSAGRLVRTLVDESLPQGLREVRWNGRDDLGGRVASGVYYYELNAGAARETRRMVLLK